MVKGPGFKMHAPKQIACRARGHVCPHSTAPCSSLLAAARSVDEVLPTSTMGVPGRLFPCELLAEPFRSFLGGVFFFCESRKDN